MLRQQERPGKGMPVEEVERWLAPNLTYDPTVAVAQASDAGSP